MPVNHLAYGEMGYEFTVPWKEREQEDEGVDKDKIYRRAFQVLDDVIPAIARKVLPSGSAEALEVGAEVASKVHGIGINFKGSSGSRPIAEFVNESKDHVSSVLSYLRDYDPNLLNHFDGLWNNGSQLAPGGKVRLDIADRDVVTVMHMNKMYGAGIPETEESALKITAMHEFMHAQHYHNAGIDILGAEGREARLAQVHEAAARKAEGKGEDALEFWKDRFYRHMPEEAYADVNAIYHFHKMHGTEVPQKVEQMFKFMQEDPTMGGILDYRKVQDGRPLLDTQNASLGMARTASRSEEELRAVRVSGTGELASALEDIARGVGTSPFTRRFGRAGLVGAGVVGGAALIHNMFTDDSHDYSKTKAVGAGVLGGVAVEALRTHMRDPAIIEGEWDQLQGMLRDGVKRSGKAWGKAFEAVNLAGGVKGKQVGSAVLGALKQAAKSRI